MRPIGHDGYHPTSVAEWLDSIELGDYTKAFLINGYTSMDLLKKLWEGELINLPEEHTKSANKYFLTDLRMLVSETLFQVLLRRQYISGPLVPGRCSHGLRDDTKDSKEKKEVAEEAEGRRNDTVDGNANEENGKQGADNEVDIEEEGWEEWQLPPILKPPSANQFNFPQCEQKIDVWQFTLLIDFHGKWRAPDAYRVSVCSAAN
ncbi:hypothetical protein STEG23_002902 [Scotinomys teguina]